MSRIFTVRRVSCCKEIVKKLLESRAIKAENVKPFITCSNCKSIHLDSRWISRGLIGQPQRTCICLSKSIIRTFSNKKMKKRKNDSKDKEDGADKDMCKIETDGAHNESNKMKISEESLMMPLNDSFISPGIQKPYGCEDIGILNYSASQALAFDPFAPGDYSHEPNLEHLQDGLDPHDDACEEIMEMVQTLKIQEVESEDAATSSRSNPTDKKKIKTKQKGAQRTFSLQERDILAKVKSEELEKATREINMKLNLHAYLDVCVSTNMVNRAYSTLIMYRNRGQRVRKMPKIRDVGIYNIVLKALADNGNMDKMNYLRNMMVEDGIALNLESLAAFLCCFASMQNVDANDVNRVIEDIRNMGFNMTDIFTRCSLRSDQCRRILKVIHTVMPDFVPVKVPISTNYDCKLLNELNENASKSRTYSPGGSAVVLKKLLEGYKEQLQCELLGQVTIKSVKKVVVDKKTLDAREQLREYGENWRSILMDSFARNLKQIQQNTSQSKFVNIYPYLMSLDPKTYVDILLQEVRTLGESSETFSPSAAFLHVQIGVKVMNRYMVQKKVKNEVVDQISRMYKKYCKYYSSENLTSKYTPREYWQKLLTDHQGGPNIDAEEKSWPQEILIGIGKFLHGMILSDVKINREGRLIPAFYSIYRNSSCRLKEEIKPHPYLAKLYKHASLEDLTFENIMTPMLSPPLPWYSVRTGGLVLSSAKIIRLPNGAVLQKQRIEATPSQQLYPIFDVLNQLGECPWIINNDILDLVIEVFNNNGNDQLDIPVLPSQCPPPPTLSQDMTRKEKFEVARQRVALKRKKAEMYSLWCDALYKYSIANHFRGKVFWFPHNLDFRGRVYPCPPHFNHLGSDVIRGVLMFANGKCLGENGLNWLKIHVVNLTGLKKRSSLSERLQYADEILDVILDSADNPLHGKKWWMASDEPWQTLACCKEIANAIRSPDHTKYVCHLAVHQDGSCNGLQHYAALGRDKKGAEQVNLSPMEMPQDVYSGVASLVEAERAKDAENGVKIAQILEGFVRRKVIKQTVMTTVYGVTRYGARHQIVRQLNDITEFPEKHVWPAAGYLANKTFNGLHKLFTASREIQDWFTECARLISLVCCQPVEWITPLGLPVIQPYYKSSKGLASVQNRMEKRKQSELGVINTERPNTMKQKNAFPPNFIHSLDSTHMMLTALYCQRAGITFVSVHDCFWTHPSTVEIMNKVCREQFVALHNEPILENLSKFLVAKYSYSDQDLKNDGSDMDEIRRKVNQILRQVPKTGEFNLEEVLSSTYFFS